MTVNIKEEKITSFQFTKFGKNLNEEEKQLISNFYDFLQGEKFKEELRACEINLCELLTKQYKKNTS